MVRKTQGVPVYRARPNHISNDKETTGEVKEATPTGSYGGSRQINSGEHIYLFIFASYADS